MFTAFTRRALLGAVCVGVDCAGKELLRSFFCDWGAGGSGARTFWPSSTGDGVSGAEAAGVDVVGTSCGCSSGKYSGPFRPQPARLNNSTGTRSVRADEIIGAV